MLFRSVSMVGDPSGAIKQENLLGVAKEISTTEFFPSATLAMDFTLYSRSAIARPVDSGINRASYCKAAAGPISFVADKNVSFPPNSCLPQGAMTSVKMDFTFQVPNNQLWGVE